jgi:hypothetical protein
VEFCAGRKAPAAVEDCSRGEDRNVTPGDKGWGAPDLATTFRPASRLARLEPFLAGRDTRHRQGGHLSPTSPAEECLNRRLSSMPENICALP